MAVPEISTRFPVSKASSPTSLPVPPEGVLRVLRTSPRGRSHLVAPAQLAMHPGGLYLCLPGSNVSTMFRATGPQRKQICRQARARAPRAWLVAIDCCVRMRGPGYPAPKRARPRPGLQILSRNSARGLQSPRTTDPEAICLDACCVDCHDGVLAERIQVDSAWPLLWHYASMLRAP